LVSQVAMSELVARANGSGSDDGEEG